MPLSWELATRSWKPEEVLSRCREPTVRVGRKHQTALRLNHRDRASVIRATMEMRLTRYERSCKKLEYARNRGLDSAFLGGNRVRRDPSPLTRYLNKSGEAEDFINILESESGQEWWGRITVWHISTWERAAPQLAGCLVDQRPTAQTRPAHSLQNRQTWFQALRQGQPLFL